MPLSSKLADKQAIDDGLELNIDGGKYVLVRI